MSNEGQMILSSMKKENTRAIKTARDSEGSDCCASHPAIRSLAERSLSNGELLGDMIMMVPDQIAAKVVEQTVVNGPVDTDALVDEVSKRRRGRLFLKRGQWEFSGDIQSALTLGLFLLGVYWFLGKHGMLPSWMQ